MKILAFESSCDETAVAVVEDGRHILSNAIASQVDIPSATAVNGTITTQPTYIMPTIPSDKKSFVQLEIVESNGTCRSSLLTCDRMESAGKYTVKLDYHDITMPLTLSTHTINKWETLFVYEGEISNPQE